MIEALLFDLDDTLYLESDYVASGYRAVARYLAENYGRSYNEVFYTMMSVFVCRGRRMVFPIVIDRFLNSSVSIPELLQVYRCHTPKIHLFPGYSELLRLLGKDHYIGIITDGLPEVQKRKVAALGLELLVDRVLYTWEYGAENEKPHPLGFSLMMDHFRVEPRKSIFVGDNPVKDCQGARAAGMKAAQIRTGRREGNAGIPDGERTADYVIDSLYELPPILRNSELK